MRGLHHEDVASFLDYGRSFILVVVDGLEIAHTQALAIFFQGSFHNMCSWFTSTT
jgi:hypothetical protein